ncbi:MAG: hypothetical protein CL583_12720 [Alteromonadaceae bacterium]|nr:hypothetical protein [Alteromonadaceae bacterium]|tara:strand:+ start:405 stop:1964 length:1560 start_codon:yes stop_codon:yes gene_type:complete
MRSIRSYFFQYLLAYIIAITGVFLAYRYYVEYPRELATVAEHQSRELRSLARSLQSDTDHLQVAVRDWSHWDDTYQFLRDPKTRTGYIEANLQPSTFEVFSLAAIAFFDADFELVFAQGFDLEDSQPRSAESLLPSPLKQTFRAGGLPGEPFQQTGWLNTALGPARYALDYVTNSLGDQPPNGYLMFVQLVTEEHIQALEEVTRLELELAAVDPNAAQPHLSPAGKIADGSHHGVADSRTQLLNNSAGQPILSLQITHDPIADPRLIGPSGIGMLLALALVPFGIGLVIDRTLLRAIRRNSARIEGMVSNNSLEELPRGFPVRELEQMRQAFNDSVRLTRGHVEQLRQISQTDSLTGIGNRRAFDEFSDQAWRQAKRLNIPFVLAVLDLDFFKEFNDRLGHPAGDDALRLVGKALDEFTPRSGDFCARLGGEEFVVILTGMQKGESMERLEVLRSSIEALAINHPDSAVAPVLTVSIGAVHVAAPLLTDHGSLQEIMDSADQALYRAKRQGRNRISTSG